MHQHRHIASLGLAMLLLASIVTIGLAPDSFASHTRKSSRSSSVEAVQQVTNSDTITIESISFYAKPDKKSKKNLDADVEVLQNGQTIGIASADLKFKKRGNTQVTVEFDPPIQVSDDFDIKIKGKGFKLDTDKDRRDRTPGYMVDNGREKEDYDINLRINGDRLYEVIENADDDGPTDPASNNPPPTSNPPPNNTPTTPPPADGSKSEIKIVSEDLAGEAITGMYVEVRQDGASVSTGFTPHTIELDNSETFEIIVANSYDTTVFSKWEDTGSTSNVRTETVTAAKTLTAVYSTPSSSTETPPTDGEDSTPPPPGSQLPPAGAGTVTVNSELLDGSAISGYYIQLRDSGGNIIDDGFTPVTFENLQEGQTYRVVAYSAGDTYFRHWDEDTWLYRYHTVTASDSGEVLTAVFEHVPSSQQARLNIIAKTTGGHIIGGTTGSDTDNSLSAEPGMEAKLAPPGSLTPYTAAFTGSSSLPFVLFEGQTYTVAMGSFGQYQFSHWEDNSSANSARAVSMSGDITLTAIYNVSS